MPTYLSIDCHFNVNFHLWHFFGDAFFSVHNNHSPFAGLLYEKIMMNYYTPGIYADGYKVVSFRSSVCMFVCSFIRTSVMFVE